MYCPKCGEEQVSGNFRYCNRCGLPLGSVSEVISNGGALPQSNASTTKKSLFTRKNGIFMGLFWFILFVPFGASFWGILGVDELAAISSVFGVFSSMIIFLFSLFFLGSGSNSTANQSVVQGNQVNRNVVSGQKSNQNALPDVQGQTAQEFVSPPQAGMWKAPDTDDLVARGSVTEGTTKLLKKEDTLNQNK